MSESDPVLTAIDSGVATVILNRPEAMNAITTELAVALGEALGDAAERADVILIRGAGGNFCVGGDFHFLESIRGDREAMRGLFESFSSSCSLIAELPVPVIAAVEGNAMAGGFELMQSCDFCLVAEGAKIGDNHSNFAMVPGGGSTQRLPRLIGPQRALGLILSGERISGAEAADWGLAYRAFPDAELSERVDELAAKLAAKDRTALARTKRLIREGLEKPLAEGLAAEIEAVLDHLGGEQAAAGIGGFTGGSNKA